MTDPSPITLMVKPANAGDLIRDPITRKPLPPEGAEVPATIHWFRRLNRGEVVEIVNEKRKGKEATS